MASTEYIDLLLLNGELVRIECKVDHFDEVMDSIDNARKRNDWWSVVMFEGTSATYMGICLDRINTNQIMGIL